MTFSIRCTFFGVICLFSFFYIKLSQNRSNGVNTCFNSRFASVKFKWATISIQILLFSTMCALLFRRCRSHVLQLHLFVCGIVLLGVVLCIRRRVLRIEGPGDRKCCRVVACGGRLYLHGSDFTVTTTHHRGFRFVSQIPDDCQKDTQ